MVSEFVSAAERGESVFITDVRAAFAEAPGSLLVRLQLTLPDRTSVKSVTIPVPNPQAMRTAERDFLVSFVRAEIYNALVTLGGSRLVIGLDPADAGLRELVADALGAFQLDAPREDREGYGRVINVVERMLFALDSAGGQSGGAHTLQIEYRDLRRMPEPTDVSFRRSPTGVFAHVTAGLQGRIVCGLDIGGTDIKAALTVDGELRLLKEHDWNPAAYGDVEAIVDPIVDIVRILRAYASDNDAASELVSAVLPRDTPPRALSDAAARMEERLGETLPRLDAIGLCFPDVVVRNKIVGGEVPKMLGLRANRSRRFEEQFAVLTALDERLQELCSPGGVIMDTNDGPMAAFTAAVELAASPNASLGDKGVFAHTLGTDLGTGFIPADGEVPAIPLEVYNLVVDLGDLPSTLLPAADVRSLNNTNTGIAGTLQRFTSQTGAFRLAFKSFSERAPELLREAREQGFLVDTEIGGTPAVVVPESPVDMRKAFLAWLMETARVDERAAAIFESIGEFLAIAWRETEHLLNTGLSNRFLFGRLVNVAECFKQIQMGAARRASELELIPADSDMAFTPLMKALDAMDEFTVAQFGQAIGAVYYANMGLHRQPSG